ncbi:MAG: substrate-binding domain-containing protein [Lachnospiraceae bacterium]
MNIRKIVGILCIMMLSVSVLMTGCIKKDVTTEETQEEEPEPTEIPEVEKVHVGISMPDDQDGFWVLSAKALTSLMEDKGYVADVVYADDNSDTQDSQISEMITAGYACLIVAPVSPDGLSISMKAASEAEIPVISYARMISDTDAVSYYVGTDMEALAQAQAEDAVTALEEKNSTGSTYIQLLPAGNPAGDALLWETKLTEALESTYQDSNTTIFTGTNGDTYKNVIPDVIIAQTDALALAQIKAYTQSSTDTLSMPVIIGQGCKKDNILALLNDTQAVDYYNDPEIFAQKTLPLVEGLIEDTDIEADATALYDNGARVVPANLCEAVRCTKDTYKKLLLDSGYYTSADLTAGAEE